MQDHGGPMQVQDCSGLQGGGGTPLLSFWLERATGRVKMVSSRLAGAMGEGAHMAMHRRGFQLVAAAGVQQRAGEWRVVGTSAPSNNGRNSELGGDAGWHKSSAATTRFGLAAPL